MSGIAKILNYEGAYPTRDKEIRRTVEETSDTEKEMGINHASITLFPNILQIHT